MKFLLAFFSLFFSFLTSSTSNVSALDSFEMYETLNKSTVRINIWENFDSDYAEIYNGGTGIVLNRIGNTYFILTNAHVVLEEYCLGEKNCKDTMYEDSISIVIDHPDSIYEYEVDSNSYTWWIEYDLAIIALEVDEEEVFSPIEIGGHWHPLLQVYGAGFPQIQGNYDKDYSDMVFCAGVVNTLFTDEEALSQLSNYSIAHSCTLAGGMSGGPLVDDEGKLLGINGLGFVAFVDEDETIDISESLFNYAVDIWDLYMLEIVSAEDEDGHFNSDSIFYNYLPMLSYDYHSDFYDSYLEIYSDRVDQINQLFE